MEIERKYLVAELPDPNGGRSVWIEQGYLALDRDSGVEVRLSRRDYTLLLTIKGGSGRSRTEEEFGLDRERFESLWALTEGRRLRKERHLIPHGGLEVELDVYGGSLEGLLIAEVEFPDEGAADSFEKPEWFGEEVTGQSAYLNQSLATEGLPR